MVTTNGDVIPPFIFLTLNIEAYIKCLEEVMFSKIERMVV